VWRVWIGETEEVADAMEWWSVREPHYPCVRRNVRTYWLYDAASAAAVIIIVVVAVAVVVTVVVVAIVITVVV
jgi:hypothetical protein